MSEVAIVARMSVKALGCVPSPNDDGSPKRLCVIFGSADGIKTGEDNNGRVWSALTGTFEGVNLKTNERFRSGKLFLPGGIHETVENAVKTLQEDSGSSVKFGLELRSVKASNPIGYSYQAVPLVQVSQEDPLAELRTAIEAKGVKLIESTATVVDAPATPAPAKKGAKK